MRRLAAILLIFIAFPLQAQWRDKCPDFTIKHKKVRVQHSYYGSASHSLRHTNYRVALDFGVSSAINTGGLSYSRINFNGGAKLKFNEHWGIHEDWLVQLHNRNWDTLFQTSDIEFVVGYAGLSIGYEWYSDRPVLGYTYMGLGTGGGKTFSNPAYSIVWVAKARNAIDHNSYWQFASFWEFNDFFSLYDDNIMWSVSMGWYLDAQSKYKK